MMEWVALLKLAGGIFVIIVAIGLAFFAIDVVIILFAVILSLLAGLLEFIWSIPFRIVEMVKNGPKQK